MKKIEKTDILSKVLSGRSFSVDVFQREYRWWSKHIEDMLTDFQNCFENGNCSVYPFKCRVKGIRRAA